MVICSVCGQGGFGYIEIRVRALQEIQACRAGRGRGGGQDDRIQPAAAIKGTVFNIADGRREHDPLNFCIPLENRVLYGCERETVDLRGQADFLWGPLAGKKSG